MPNPKPKIRAIKLLRTLFLNISSILPKGSSEVMLPNVSFSNPSKFSDASGFLAEIKYPITNETMKIPAEARKYFFDE